MKNDTKAVPFLLLAIVLSIWVFLPAEKAMALEYDSWKYAYQEVLSGNMEIYIKAEALENINIPLSRQFFKEETGYTMQDILAFLQEVYGLDGKIPVIHYAYPDCGGDGTMDMAVRFSGLNSWWMDTVTIVISYQNGRMELCHAFQTWSRSDTELYYYGLLEEEGSSGAGEQGYGSSFLDENGDLKVIYTMTETLADFSCYYESEEYRRLFETGEPRMYISGYAIGGTGEYFAAYRIEEEEQERIDFCEKYVERIVPQGTRLYTREEIDERIKKQREKLGIHDVWMQKRKLEWIFFPAEKYGTCVDIGSTEKMKSFLTDFLNCHADAFESRYDLGELYRRGILYDAGEVRAVRFTSGQPCAIYEEKNVGDVRDGENLSGIHADIYGSRKADIDFEADISIEIFPLEQPDCAVSVCWKKEEDGTWWIWEISYLRRETAEQTTPLSFFSSWEEAYYRKQTDGKREEAYYCGKADDRRKEQRYVSPDRTRMVIEGVYDPLQIYIGDWYGQIKDVYKTGERSMTEWIGEEHLLYREVSGRLCLLHLENGRIEVISEGEGYTGYVLDGEYIIGKNRTETKVLWKIVQDGTDVEPVDVEKERIAYPLTPETGTVKGLYQQFLDGQRTVFMGAEWEREFFCYNDENITAKEYNLQELMERVKEEYRQEWTDKPLEFQYAYLDCGGDGKPDLAVRFRNIYGVQDKSNLTFLIMNRNNRLEVVYGRVSHIRDDAEFYYYGYVCMAGSMGAGAQSFGETFIDGNGREKEILERKVLNYFIGEDVLPTEERHKSAQIEEWELGGDIYYNFDIAQPVYKDEYEEYMAFFEGKGMRFLSFHELKERRGERLQRFGIESEWLAHKTLIWME